MAFQRAPLRQVSERSGPETAESVLISALLDSGDFTPERYHLSVDDLTCWHQLWSFCTEYQKRSGEAPPIALIKNKFPEFEPIFGVSPSWAAGVLHDEAASRRMRTQMTEATLAIQKQDISAAYEALKAITPPKSARKAPVDGFEAWGQETQAVTKISVPFKTLKSITSGGIAPGELWYVGARPGDGKTFTLCSFVAEAMREGVNVGYLSLEMPAVKISQRVMRILAKRSIEKDLYTKIEGVLMERKYALGRLKEITPGSLKVIDPSHSKATSTIVREMMDEYDLVCVDHVGLMSTSDGRKAVDDWRAMATISNQLIEDKLATNVPVLAAAQLNRTAETASRSAPKASTLSQSDALNQDADVVITMRRMGLAMAYSAEKVRDGSNGKWWSKFDPGTCEFGEISKDMAEVICQDTADPND